MPTEEQHIAAANRTHDTIQHLLNEKELTSPWVATTAFYKALQIVEAVFHNDTIRPHTGSHGERDDRLKRTNQYRQLYKHYGPLKRASQIARYLDHNPDFDAYMSPDTVVSTLLKNHLKQVEATARKFLRSPDSLKGIEVIV